MEEAEVYFELLFWHSLQGTEENHNIQKIRYPGRDSNQIPLSVEMNIIKYNSLEVKIHFKKHNDHVAACFFYMKSGEF
jgi:hypothetical protein